MEPEELRSEQRWSNIPQHSVPNGYWPQALDEKLLVLVTHATASGDRFPVGVNWLDISRSIGYSPVECVKRYAFLHNARGRLSGQDAHQLQKGEEITRHEDAVDKHAEDTHNPFAGLSGSDDLGSPHSRAFLEYGSPLVSPRLQSLGDSGEFGVSSPASPPPFALRTAGKNGPSVTSPLRWESLAKETYSSPILKQPPHVLRQQQQLRTSFGVGELEDIESKRTTFEDSQSPRIVFGTQHHSKFTDPNFAADIVNHAFKGLRFDDDIPATTSTSPPRMTRAISNSEYPFLKDDERKAPFGQAAQSSRTAVVGQRLVDGPPNPRARPLSALQSSSPLVGSPGSQMLASFGGDNPFTGSLTQSALEEAFLDMAGSRLDASGTSMLFASRYAAGQSRIQQSDPQQQAAGHQHRQQQQQLDQQQRQASQQNWSRSGPRQ